MSETWQGWMDLGPPVEVAGRGPWLELSHTFYEDMSYFPTFRAPRFEQIKRMPGDPLNLTEIQLIVHVGTHVDAPCHFIPNGPSIDEISLDRLHGQAVVWRIIMEPYGVIEPAVLDKMEPSVQRGDIVILDTGWWEHFGTEQYDRNYSLSPEAAQWLVERGVKLVGVDCGTVDLADSRREAGFDWPVHHILLGNGVLIAEHLTNLRALSGKRAEVFFMPLKIKGADGAPARVIAREMRD